MKKSKFLILAFILILVGCQNNDDFAGSQIKSFEGGALLSRSSNYFPTGWETLDSYDAKVNALQLSDQLLNSFSTPELVDVCLSYPLNLDCFLFSDVNFGVRSVVSNFNGYAKLFSRPDAMSSLINVYKQRVDALSVADNVNGNSIVNPLEFSFLEYLIAENFDGNSLPDSLKVKLGDVALLAADLRISKTELSGDISMNSITNLISKIAPESALYYPSKESKIRIKINNNRDIVVWTRKCQGNAFETQASYDLISQKHPNVTIVGEATCTYNCHAYAWYLTEGNTTKCWINQYEDGVHNIALFYTDGTYKETYKPYAQKIYYEAGDHSAIATEIDGIYESKWGANHLVRHSLNDCPYSKSKMRYFTKDLTAIPFVVEGIPSCAENYDDPISVNSSLNFWMPETYNAAAYRTEIYVCSVKDSETPVSSDVVSISSQTKTSAKFTFKKSGFYNVYFKAYEVSTGYLAANLVSYEIYVEN